MRAPWSAADRNWLWVPPVSKRVSPRLPWPPARGAAESRDAPLRPCECELPRFTWHWADPYREEAVRAAREFLKLRKQCYCACRAGTTGVGVVRVGVGGNPGAQSALALRTLMTVPRILNHPGSTRIGLRVASVTLALRIQHHALVIGHSLSARRRTAGHAGLARTRASDHVHAGVCNRCYHSMQSHAAKAMSHMRRARRHGQYGRHCIDDGGGGDGSDYNGSDDSGSKSSSARWRH